MSDTTAPRQRNWTRFARNISAGIVASIAGYASYWHQVHVALAAGERTELAHVIPLSVDGVLVVASVCMVDARREGRKPSWQTKVGFAAGIAASVGANVMSAQPTTLGRLVAAWPALALLLVVEMLSSKGKLIREMGPTMTTTPELTAEMAEVPVSPAPAGASGKRAPYGPRDGVDYSPRQKQRHAGGK
jgi:hypothetical protein